jgi:electron transport complex protein RnfB
MTGVYERLAKHLDNLPASYPATDSGVELRILKRLFTPEEAEATMALTMFPESADIIAKKLGKNETATEKLFYSMSQKGLIGRIVNHPHLQLTIGKSVHRNQTEYES